MVNKNVVVEEVREMSEEAAFFKWLAGIGFGISAALTALVWNDNKQRVEELTQKLDKKADANDVERVEASLSAKADIREIEKLNQSQGRLFELVDRLKDQIHEGHAAILTQVNLVHTDVIQKISQKQDRV